MKVDISDDLFIYEVEFSTNIRNFLISLVNLIDENGEEICFCVFVDHIVDRKLKKVFEEEFVYYEDAFRKFIELENEIVEKGCI